MPIKPEKFLAAFLIKYAGFSKNQFCVFYLFRNCLNLARKINYDDFLEKGLSKIIVLFMVNLNSF
ncbi:hypothetical protein D0T49_08995 [Paludibacter sp. 221]|nr:hypothetical protein [Paludibacter sp. 221]